MLEQYAFYILAGGSRAGPRQHRLVKRAFASAGAEVAAVRSIKSSSCAPPAKPPDPLAVLLAAVPAAALQRQILRRHFVPLRPFEQRVDGDARHAGLKDFDYATLKGWDDIIVLQMASPDVDDHTLAIWRNDQASRWTWAIPRFPTRAADRHARQRWRSCTCPTHISDGLPEASRAQNRYGS